MDELLRIICQALLDGLDASVLSDRPLQARPDLAQVVWSAWLARADEPALRLALTDIAPAPRDQFEQAVDRALARLTEARQSETDRSLRSYLRGLSSCCRRQLGRPGQVDASTALSTPPLRSPDELAPLLPPAAPWFEPG